MVKKKSSAKTADGDLLVTSLSLHNLSITYMTTTNNVLNTVMIAFPNPFNGIAAALLDERV